MQYLALITSQKLLKYGNTKFQMFRTSCNYIRLFYCHGHNVLYTLYLHHKAQQYTHTLTDSHCDVLLSLLMHSILIMNFFKYYRSIHLCYLLQQEGILQPQCGQLLPSIIFNLQFLISLLLYHLFKMLKKFHYTQI
jgi:hypothetical protein